MKRIKETRKRVSRALNQFTSSPLSPVVPESHAETATMEKFLNDMAREKPIRFTLDHLIQFTHNFSASLGYGTVGEVFEGAFPNGVPIAVKVFHGNLERIVEEKFMAEISTIGRTDHINVVRLYGFCFDLSIQALVYEYMENGSLDMLLFRKNPRIEWEKLQVIAIGTAKGIAYLHEKCEQRIIHYAIKPCNVLLDRNFSPKVADFRLANVLGLGRTPDSTDVGRGTMDYAAPELLMLRPVTRKCDVYSFGMMLFEIVGRRRNFDIGVSESQKWFPRLFWKKFEDGELEELIASFEMEEGNRESMERMAMVALWCVQFLPESRPSMSTVVKMLEGGSQIRRPPNPFPHLVADEASPLDWRNIERGFKLISAECLPEPNGSGTVMMEKFLNDIAREKPIRFTPHQLTEFTADYSTKLGSGAFGEVYRGSFPDGVQIAVKVLKGNLDETVEEQFMAEISTIGKTYHKNLIRLNGFCFDLSIRALVYEYMENGSLDTFLFTKNPKIEWGKLQEIAIGTAKGIAYLHEECEQRIIHYDIKPGNVLLDRNFSPKVADFGLAKLLEKDRSHVTMKGVRGTVGYAAPELWMPLRVTHKCDVYSFGIMLFEIVGRRRNLDDNLSENQKWFPRWVWKRFEDGEVKEMIEGLEIEEENRGNAERMVVVALWCVQFLPESRPPMSSVVRMLEGGSEIPVPSNPFQHLVASNASQLVWSETESGSGSGSGSGSMFVDGSKSTSSTTRFKGVNEPNRHCV